MVPAAGGRQLQRFSPQLTPQGLNHGMFFGGCRRLRSLCRFSSCVLHFSLDGCANAKDAEEDLHQHFPVPLHGGRLKFIGATETHGSPHDAEECGGTENRADGDFLMGDFGNVFSPTGADFIFIGSLPRGARRHIRRRCHNRRRRG